MTRWLALALMVLLGCSDESGDDDSKRTALPKVGDSLEGGTVIEVRATDEACYAATVQRAAPWACTSEQVQAAMSEPADTAGTIVRTRDGRVGLQQSDCATLSALRRPAIKNGLLAQLRSERQARLVQCLPITSVHYFTDSGRPAAYRCGERTPPAPVDASTDSAAPPLPPLVPPPSDQTAWGAARNASTDKRIDEADFVQLDDENAYVLSRSGLHVLDTSPAPATHEVAHVAIPTALRMLLAGDRLVVYARAPSADSPAREECLYVNSCNGPDPDGTAILVFDVSTPSAPRELARYELSGGYMDSHRVGNFVYTVVGDDFRRRPTDIELHLTAQDPVQLEVEYTSKVQQVDALVDGLALDHFLPSMRTNLGSQTTPSRCESTLSTREADGTTFTTIAAIDLTALDTPRRLILAGSPSFSHASGDSLYFVTNGLTAAWPFTLPLDGWLDGSVLDKFALRGLELPYVGSVLLAGNVAGPYAMHTRDSALRVATSGIHTRSPNGLSTTLVTVTERDGALAVAAQLDPLHGEGPPTIRFDGDRAFLRTNNVATLKVIDLTALRVQSELPQLPVTLYTHPVDTDHVLTISRPLDDVGNFDASQGPQLRIYELSTAKLLHETAVSTNDSTFDVSTDALAYNYDPQTGLLLLPMTLCGEDYGLAFSGLLAFDISVQNGITERGRMPFVQPDDALNCPLWSIDYKSTVKRSTVLSDHVLAMSDAELRVAPLSQMDTLLQQLPLGSKILP